MAAFGAIEGDDGVAVEIARGFGAAVPSDIGAAGVDRPRRVGELAADERAVLAFPGAQRNVGFALRQVEILVGDEEIDAQGRIARVKHVEHPWNETVGHSFGTGQPHRARWRGVGRGDLAVEAGDRRFDGFRVRPHLLAKAGQPVTDRQALDQFAADRFFKRGEPPLHRRLVDAEILRGSDGRAGACDGEEITQVVPVETIHSAILRRHRANLRLPPSPPPRYTRHRER
jgi:hypothetical protein